MKKIVLFFVILSNLASAQGSLKNNEKFLGSVKSKIKPNSNANQGKTTWSKPQCIEDSLVQLAWRNSNWAINFKTLYSYDNHYNNFIQTQYTLMGQNWFSNYRFVCTYNSVDSVTEKLHQYSNSSTNSWTSNSRTTYTYDLQNNQTIAYSQRWDFPSSAWLDDSKNLRSYNSTHAVLTETLQVADATTNILVNTDKYSYNYDIFNNIVDALWQEWDPVTHTWQNSEKGIITKSGNTSTILILTWNGSTWVNEERYVSVLDNAQNTLSETTQVWDGTNWKNQFKTSFTYNSQNKMTQQYQEYWDPNNVLLANDQIDITYDNYGNQLSQIEKIKDVSTGLWNNSTANWMYYNCKTVGVPELSSPFTQLQLFPNPTQSELFIVCEKNYKTASITSMSGQEVFTSEASGAISISHLTPGIYFLSLKNENGVVIGFKKFIKN